MGCDIHAHFEIKVNGKWEHYSTPRIQRYYSLFTRIAGVRNVPAIIPICKPKGMPEKISVITYMDYKNCGYDGHSHTWLDARDIKELFETDFIKDDFRFEHDQFGYLFGNGWGDWIENPKGYPEEIEDIRFICWFDN